MKSKTLDIEKFIQELSETHCWSNTRRFDFSRSLRIYATDTPINNETARFFRLTEISTEEEVVLRQNLENVIACLDNTDFRGSIIFQVRRQGLSFIWVWFEQNIYRHKGMYVTMLFC